MQKFALDEFEKNIGVNYKEILDNKYVINRELAKKDFNLLLNGVKCQETKDLDLKIKNYCFRNKLNYDDIIREFPINIHLQINLMKDPAKQNLLEPAAFKVLQSFNIFDKNCLVNLPNGGKNAKSLTIKGIKNGVYHENNAKTIDFFATYKDKQFVFCQKYTNEGGGGQKNQLIDVENFMKLGTLCEDRNIYVISLLDGEYFLQIQENYKDSYEYLNRKFHTNCYNVFATDTNHLKDVINHFINNIEF